MQKLTIDTESSFNGKVLLFGEYCVILGAEALAIPIKNFSGNLELKDQYSEQNLAPFIQYLGALHQIDLHQDLIEELDLDKLIFNSNIPVGYGAGSSGALTAAIYNAIVTNRKLEAELLREDLASIEDFFHGSSSGLDPLVSYLNQGVAIRDGAFETFTLDHQIKDSLAHFALIDSGISRKTGPLVEIFKSKFEKSDFKERMQVLVELNERAIEVFRSGMIKELAQIIASISKFQFEYFQEMIPESLQEIWRTSLHVDGLSLKLCGAGGGGFFLLFSENVSNLDVWSRKHELSIQHIMT